MSTQVAAASLAEANFTYESQTDLHVYTHAVPWAAITQDVLEPAASFRERRAGTPGASLP